MEIADFNKNKLNAWSFSRLTLYESCPYRAKLQYIDKIPENERPLPPGKTEHANDRGSRIHQAAEDYIQLKREDLVEELLYFEHEFAHLRSMYEANNESVSCEGLWCFDEGWRSVDPDDCDNIWLRVIIDALVWTAPDEVIIVDHKSGKRYGNEIKHGQQMTLYALAVAMKYPQVQTIHTELWYVDQNELAYMKYTRDQAMSFLKRFNLRALTLCEDTEFKPNPNKSSCFFCPYGGADNKWVTKTGDCEHGL